jgi:hypothetical protein
MDQPRFRPETKIKIYFVLGGREAAEKRPSYSYGGQLVSLVGGKRSKKKMQTGPGSLH